MKGRILTRLRPTDMLEIVVPISYLNRDIMISFWYISLGVAGLTINHIKFMSLSVNHVNSFWFIKR